MWNQAVTGTCDCTPLHLLPVVYTDGLLLMCARNIGLEIVAGFLMINSDVELAFVSEPIKPVVATADVNAMAAGNPGLPREFVWRGEKLEIAAVLRTWRETGLCRHSRSESYVRKHWFEVETLSNRRARIYFERQARGGNRKQRWWLFSIEERDDAEQPELAGDD